MFNLTPSGSTTPVLVATLNAAGNFSATTLSSTVTTGTAPLTVASTTVVPNLNAALLNGTTFAAPGPIGGTTPGVGSFSSLTTVGTAATQATGLQLTGTTTAGNAVMVTNTGGSTYVGMTDSTGANFITGATAYDGIIRSTSGLSFSANNGAAVQMRLASTGTLAVTGGVDKLTTASGVVSVAAATAPSSGQVLTATGATTANWQTPTTTTASNKIQNPLVTVVTNALNVTWAGGWLDFRNATSTNGAVTTANIVSITALAISNPTTSSFGVGTGTSGRLVIGVAYAAGSPQLIIANLSGGLQMDESNLITTSQMTGTIVSSTTWYSNTAIATPTPYKIIGYVDATWTNGSGWTISAVQGAGGYSLMSVTPTPKIDYISTAGYNGMFMLSNGVLYYSGTDGANNGYYTNPNGGNTSQATFGLRFGWTRVVLPPGSGLVKKIINTGINVAVLCHNGNLYTWGYNGQGQCGLGNTSQIARPTLSATGVQDLWGNTAGGFEVQYANFFYKASTGYIFSCGYNSYGQLGNGNSTNQSSWVQITTLGTNISKMWVGAGNPGISYAWDPVAGAFWAWGNGTYGTLGNGTTTAINSTPLNVTSNWGLSVSVTPVDMAFAFDYYTTGANASTAAYLRRSDGYILSAGYNNNNMIGNGNTTQQNTPYSVWTGSLGTAVDMAVHGLGSCYVLTAANTVYGWGYNGQYQMGSGNTTNVSTPTLISGITANTILNRYCSSELYGYYTQAFFSMTGSNTYYVVGNNDASGYYGNGSTTQSTTAATCYLPDGEWFTQIGTQCGQTNAHSYLGVTNMNKLYCWGNGSNSSINYGIANHCLFLTSVANPFRNNL